LALGKRKVAQGEEEIRAATLRRTGTNWKILLPTVTADDRSLPS